MTALQTLEAFVAPSLGQRSIEYLFEPCGDGEIALADRDKVEQIMLNLLSNAIKFTDARRIAVRCNTRDDRLDIEVSDTGRGIRRELLDEIFEPFAQGDEHLTRTHRGTGLGLAISR